MPAAPRRVLVTHGEPAAAQALAARLHEALGWRTEVPAMGDTADLS
jgi:metallo-beta-lactamase family protein